MTEYNKTNLRQGCISLAVAIVAFSAIVMFVESCKSSTPLWSIVAPIAAAVYGCITLVKQYWPEKK